MFFHRAKLFGTTEFQIQIVIHFNSYFLKGY